jgi:hypothetical protein
MKDAKARVVCFGGETRGTKARALKTVQSLSPDENGFF